MPDNIAVQTQAENWQVECWKLARSKTTFHVEGETTEQHHFFFAELGYAYGYNIKQEPQWVVFIPLESF